jgi:large subunit ribosomal protein L9
MKLLLTKNVTHLGIVGDVVNVSSGYARNYLLPRRLATEPSDVNVKRLAEARKVAEAEMARERAHLEAMLQKLEGVEITVKARANEDGVLYGSVGRKEIVAALAEEGHVVLVEHVALQQPIRRVDTVPIDIRFASDLKTTIKLWVVREKEEGEEEESPEGAAVGTEAGTHDKAGEQ